MSDNERPIDVVFLSGAARSGTTLAHALICTSPRVNDYVAECSFLSQMVRAFDRGDETFDVHTRHYFDDRQAYVDLNRTLVATALTSHWKHLGRPQLLVLKDPDMLPILASFAALVPHAKFVVMYRDPRDVIASRTQVQKRRNPSMDVMDAGNIAGLCDEYVSGYAAAAELARSGGRVLFKSYEGLIDREFRDLEAFLGAADIDPSRVWANSRVEKGSYAGDPWDSPLYFRPMSRDAVGSYRTILTPDAIRWVEERCGPTMEGLRHLSSTDASR